VGPAGHIPAKAVQGCHAGKYTSSGLPGISALQIGCDFPVGARRRAVERRNWISPRPESRQGKCP